MNMSSPMRTLTVDLGDRGYPIFIGSGLIDDSTLYSPHIQGGQVMVVSNETVAPLYLERVEAALSVYRLARVILPDGEQYKTLDVLDQIYTALLEHRFDRRCTLLALGGGVVGGQPGLPGSSRRRGPRPRRRALPVRIGPGR